MYERTFFRHFYKRNTVSYGNNGPRTELDITQYPENSLENILESPDRDVKNQNLKG